MPFDSVGVAEDGRSIWGCGRGQVLNLGVWQRTGAQFAGGAKERLGWKHSSKQTSPGNFKHGEHL